MTDAQSPVHEHRPFEVLYEEALADSQLSANLDTFQSSWKRTRDAQFRDDEFAEYRDRLRTAKVEAIDHIDEYLTQFIAAAEAAGSHVHRAATAEDANRIIADIALRHDIKLVAKSKSMVSEEIFLNEALANVGVDAIETDLGEWLVQKRHERPSHMVMPAIHLSRQQTAQVIGEALDRDVPQDDVTAQVHIARDAIRDVFFAAGMGMTGANALIAESGAVMMVTNEGNGRLTSSIPPVHVVLAGIEKLVPTYEDAMAQVRVLARNATAQRITVYTTFIQGPTPGHEQHIVLLDNGRTAMRDRPEFRDALHCIRCAACANVCPPYREVGGHVFGHVYTGAIGLVVTPFLHSLDDIAGPQSLCLSCNACEAVCPVGIPLPRQILDVRKMVVKKKGMKTAKQVILSAYAQPNIRNLILKVGRRAQKPFVGKSGFIRLRRVPIINRQTSWRSLPHLADPLPTTTADHNATQLSSKAVGLTLALYPGCVTEMLYPEQIQATMQIVDALGASVTYPADLGCCGLIPNNSGDEPNARKLAIATMERLEAIPADIIVSPNASCVAMMVEDYQHLFRDEPKLFVRAETLARRVMDFTSFLVNVAQLEPGALVASDGMSRKITYHDSCQGKNALGLRDEPRYLIEDVLGDELVELAEQNCCGFGGSFSVEQPRLAAKIMDRKLALAAETHADIIVTDNQGCIMHLRGGLDAKRRQTRVLHIAELLAERLPAD